MNFNYDSYVSMDKFMDNKANSSAVLVTSTMRINEIRSKLTSYKKAFVYPDTDSVYCRFIYEWSICSSDKSKTAASERLLSWMLGNVYQSSLMINMSGKGEIPINKDAYFTRINSDYYAGMSGEGYTRFVFKYEENAEG